MEQENNAICCPEFNPALWDDKTFTWENKRFIRDHVCCFFNMPLNFGSVMRKVMPGIMKAGAEMPDAMGLSDHTSKWNMDIYIAVDREIPEAENVTLSGTFYCKVYEGPFGDTGKWCKDFESAVKSKGLPLKKMYLWYTTCPKCAKKYGKNYVAIMGQVG